MSGSLSFTFCENNSFPHDITVVAFGRFKNNNDYYYNNNDKGHYDARRGP